MSMEARTMKQLPEVLLSIRVSQNTMDKNFFFKIPIETPVKVSLRYNNTLCKISSHSEEF